MRIDLSGCTALVTGSTGGIGFAVATGLACAGATVVINGRQQARVAAAVERLRSAVPDASVRGVAADVGTAQGCDALLAAEPSVDILINNAGVFGPQDFFETPDSEWQRFLEVNVLSGVRLSRAYAPGMVERGWGRVIFISSESALNIPADMIHYGVTKTANLAVSRGLAKRLAGTGVTVNAVLPGPTLSEGVQAMLEGQVDGRSIEAVATDFVRSERPSSIIGRAASVEEVANMVVYVASPQASASTGAALRVDGGVVDTIA
ncbi:SDR family NAD(P)-dependent oxidoreductase [Algiphilus aromaticivorans]|uniref:SDR family NAD(P)-dependent oxidoreductase n=1 Tax=Algiphilus aromaticivorans TaxID=382454 RepID=UPI0005C22A6B|nr:SDR family oxidoreductase [Algiphilus aromaticivorans]